MRQTWASAPVCPAWGCFLVSCNVLTGTDGGNPRWKSWGASRAAKLKEVGNKPLTVGTRIGREAAYGR